MAGRRPATLRPEVLEADPARCLRWLGRVLVPGLSDGEHTFTIEPAGADRVRPDPAGGVPPPSSGWPAAGPAP